MANRQLNRPAAFKDVNYARSVRLLDARSISLLEDYLSVMQIDELLKYQERTDTGLIANRDWARTVLASSGASRCA